MVTGGLTVTLLVGIVGFACGATVLVVDGAMSEVGCGVVCPAGGLAGRPAATEEDLTKAGPGDEAMTLAMPEDTPNQATAVAVAVPSAQVVIAMDRRTSTSVHRLQCVLG